MSHPRIPKTMNRTKDWRQLSALAGENPIVASIIETSLSEASRRVACARPLGPHRASFKDGVLRTASILASMAAETEDCETTTEKVS